MITKRDWIKWGAIALLAGLAFAAFILMLARAFPAHAAFAERPGQFQYLALPLETERDPGNPNLVSVYIVDGNGDRWPISRAGDECWQLGGVITDTVGPIGVFTRRVEDASCADVAAPGPGGAP